MWKLGFNAKNLEMWEIIFSTPLSDPIFVVFDRANMKAVEAAIDSRQWSKAVQILELQDSSSSSKYYKRIADHYASIGDYDVRYKSRKSLENSSLDIYNKNKFKYSLHYFQQNLLICHGNQV